MAGLSRRGGAVADPFAAGPGSVGQDDQYAVVGPTMPTTGTPGQGNGNGISDPYATLAAQQGTANHSTANRPATSTTATDLDEHPRNNDEHSGGANRQPAVFPVADSPPAPTAATAWAPPAPVSTPQVAWSAGRPGPMDLDAITAKLTHDLAELAEIRASYEDALSHDGSNELVRQTELREVAAAEVAKVLDAQNTEVERVIGVVCRDVNAGLELIGSGMKQVQKGLTELGKVNGVQGQAQRMISDLQERLDTAIADQ